LCGNIRANMFAQLRRYQIRREGGVTATLHPSNCYLEI
jgi:hypothetical protein